MEQSANSVSRAVKYAVALNIMTASVAQQIITFRPMSVKFAN
jgi:hypothetical protein